MNIIITMAGKGSRFISAGYKLPKFMIKVKDKTLFHWSMLSLKDFFSTEKFIFVVRKEHSADKFIEDECKKIGIKKFAIMNLDSETDGQATTAMLTRPLLNSKESIFIYNIDTFIEPGCMKAEDLRGDGFIPCFKQGGDHWSFVRLDSNGKVVEVAEKRRISDNCSVGAYYFKSFDLYSKLYDSYYLKCTGNLVGGEKYIAPLYNELIKRNGEVYMSVIESSKVHILGTPEEVEVFAKSDFDGEKL